MHDRLQAAGGERTPKSCCEDVGALNPVLAGPFAGRKDGP